MFLNLFVCSKLRQYLLQTMRCHMKNLVLFFLFVCLSLACCTSATTKQEPSAEKVINTDASEAIPEDKTSDKNTAESKPEKERPDCDCVKTLYFSAKNGFKDGPANEALFNGTTSIALNLEEQVLYITDPNNYRIRQFDLKTNTVSTFAGSGEPASKDGSNYRDGSKEKATFYRPDSIAFDQKKKTLYVAEASSCRVRAISASGMVSTIMPSCGDKGDFHDPYEKTPDYGRIAMGPNGDLYLFGFRHALRKVDFASKTIVYITGASSSAGGRHPIDGKLKDATFPHSRFFTVDPNGIAWIVSEQGHRVRKIDPANDLVSTVAGDGTFDQVDGPKETSRVGRSRGIVFDRGAVYFVDYVYGGDLPYHKNSDKIGYYLRKLDTSTFELSTIGGMPYIDEPGGVVDGSLAEANYIRGHLASDDSGTLYMVSVTSIRKVKLDCKCGTTSP